MTNNYKIIRTVKKGWTKQPNAIIRDKNLTSDAYKVISFLLSVTGDYNISIKGISKTINLSESKVKRAVALLQRNGYLKIEKVKLGKVFGCRWLISDAPGVYGECTGGQSMDARPMDGQSMYEKSMDGKSIDAPIYEYTDRYKQTNEKRIDEQQIAEEQIPSTSSLPSPTSAPQTIRSEEEANDSLPNPTVFTPQFSSVANAPSLSNKNSNQPQPISQKEYLYQQFLKKYPKRPTGSEAAATKKAFFEIPDLENNFEMIMAGLDDWCNSVDWNKEGGRYITKPLNFITLRKWEEIPCTIKTEIDPGLLKFITVDMEEYL